ncbi:MAG: polysaccharide deacetylase family protein [Desulfovibrionaceae bacterium]|nr:polysaccharide deacetylase family protein [Desulfovibrionaceae bacterium]
MQVLSVCIVILFSLLSTVCAFSADANDWAPTAADELRAIRNNAESPARKQPVTVLPALAQDRVGLVRKVQIDTSDRPIALTFDLCELATVTTGCDMQTIAFLHDNRIPATFFAGGKWMRTHAKRMKQMLSVPFFEFGNHAWTHGNCALLSSRGLRAQVLWTQAQYELLREEAIEQGGRPDIPPVPTLFRLPYGRCTKQALTEIAALGLTVVQWDIVAERGAVRTEDAARRYAASLVKECAPGSILLFHANRVPTGTALLVREVVSKLRAENWRFVTVSELLTLGRPVLVEDGYFTRPGDNIALDKKFGRDGTGSRVRFEGE